jgi:hypothetical protein
MALHSHERERQRRILAFLLSTPAYAPALERMTCLRSGIGTNGAANRPFVGRVCGGDLVGHREYAAPLIAAFLQCPECAVSCVLTQSGQSVSDGFTRKSTCLVMHAAMG